MGLGRGGMQKTHHPRPQVNADEGMGNVSGSQTRFRELCPLGVFLASALIQASLLAQG